MWSAVWIKQLEMKRAGEAGRRICQPSKSMFRLRQTGQKKVTDALSYKPGISELFKNSVVSLQVLTKGESQKVPNFFSCVSFTLYCPPSQAHEGIHSWLHWFRGSKKCARRPCPLCQGWEILLHHQKIKSNLWQPGQNCMGQSMTCFWWTGTP